MEKTGNVPIKLFEEITEDLTKYEREILVPVFVRGFKKKLGKSNSVTNKQIVFMMKPKYQVNDARVRKIINYIRNHDMVPGLVGTSRGYYVTRNLEELVSYAKSLRSRAHEILRVESHIMKYAKELAPKLQVKLSYSELDR